MKKWIIVAALVLVTVLIALSFWTRRTPKPSPAISNEPGLNSERVNRLKTSYNKALTSQQEFFKDRYAFTAMVNQVVEESGLPKGTQFNIQVANCQPPAPDGSVKCEQTVTPVLPQASPAVNEPKK